MNDLINFLPAGTVWAVIGVFLFLMLLLLFNSAVMQAQLKKVLVFLFIIVVISVGYFLLTGKYPTQIPGEINKYFNTPRAPEKGTHKYSSDFEKRFGDQLKE